MELVELGFKVGYLLGNRDDSNWNEKEREIMDKWLKLMEKKWNDELKRLMYCGLSKEEWDKVC